MLCYYCIQVYHGGFYAGHKDAIGICRHCGVGVCGKHGKKAIEPGSPLLCLECAELLALATDQQMPQKTPVAT